MRGLVAVTAVLLTATAALAADWTVAPAPSDDPTLQAAVAESAEGHTLYVWSNRMGGLHQIFAELHLADGEQFAGEMPTYRIDEGAAIDSEQIRRDGDARGLLWGHLGDRVAFWLIWASPAPVIAPRAPIRDWFDGTLLEISFRAADGEVQIARFGLEGAASAIPAATAIRFQ